MKNIDELWKKLQLTEEEGNNIDIADEEVEEVQRKGNLCLLIGKVWVDRAIGQGVVEVIMLKIWRLNAKAVFREVGPNIFIISFYVHAE